MMKILEAPLIFVYKIEFFKKALENVK